MELIEAYRKVYRMLPPECRKQAYPVLFFMLLNGVLEVSGIASVLPFMTVASNPSVVESNIYLGRFQEWTGVSDPNSFLGLLGGIFLLLFGAVNLCTAITLWLSCRFSYGVSHHLSLSLLRQYLSRSFAWYLTRNSSDLVKDVLDEIDRLVENLVLRLVETLTSAVTSVLIFSGLILLNPAVALSTIVVIALLYNRIYRFYKTYLTTSGEERARLNTRRYRAVSQALASMKEARAFDRRSYFLEGFRGHSDTHKDVLAKHKLIGELPKYLTETLAVGAIVGVLIFLTVFRAESVESALPLVGLYIMATWRLVPAVQNLYKNAIRVKLYLPALEACAQELALPLEKAWTVSDHTEPLPLKHGISLKGVQFSYPGSEVKVIDGVDLEIQKNSSLALVGRTGEGKTTLADLISGYLVPTAGEVQVDGEPLKDERLGAWHKNIGCVPQEIYLLDDTVRRNIALGIPDGQVDQERVSEAARIAGVHDFIVNDLPKGYDTVLGERGTSLSGGQRQRVGIARALYHDPELLVLDEATSSLDNLTEKSVMDAISALADRKTMVIVAHRLSTLKACSRICLVERGRIVATGSFEELLSNSPEFKELAKDQFGLEGRAV